MRQWMIILGYKKLFIIHFILQIIGWLIHLWVSNFDTFESVLNLDYLPLEPKLYELNRENSIIEN